MCSKGHTHKHNTHTHIHKYTEGKKKKERERETDTRVFLASVLYNLSNNEESRHCCLLYHNKVSSPTLSFVGTDSLPVCIRRSSVQMRSCVLNRSSTIPEYLGSPGNKRAEQKNKIV